MSHKNNRNSIIDSWNRERLDRSKDPKKDKPVTKMFKEDWRLIFQSLASDINSLLRQDVLSEQDLHWIRRKVELSEKILPKFLNQNTRQYQSILTDFDNILKGVYN